MQSPAEPSSREQVPHGCPTKISFDHGPDRQSTSPSLASASPCVHASDSNPPQCTASKHTPTPLCFVHCGSLADPGSGRFSGPCPQTKKCSAPPPAKISPTCMHPALAGTVGVGGSHRDSHHQIHFRGLAWNPKSSRTRARGGRSLNLSPQAPFLKKKQSGAFNPLVSLEPCVDTHGPHGPRVALTD